MAESVERNTATAPRNAWDMLRREARRRGVALSVVTAEAITEKADRVRAELPEPKLQPARGDRDIVPGETSEPVAGPLR